MKQILFLSIILVTLGSCVNQRQKSNIIGRSDEVYFTPSDTRIKVYASDNNGEYSQAPSKPATSNYAGSYSDRLSNFGSCNRFNYSNYQPMMMTTVVYNSYPGGWNSGVGYGFQYGYGYNSPFSPYYGCNMPYNDPFYSYGWGGGWMTNYYPYYIYNPYMFNYNPYSYGNYGGYNNYNQYNYNNSGTGGSTNYARRTGVNSPSTWNNQPARSDNKNTTNTGKNNNTNSGNTGNGGWWNSGGSGSGSSSSGGTGGGGGGRSSSGSGGSGSTRRR